MSFIFNVINTPSFILIVRAVQCTCISVKLSEWWANASDEWVWVCWFSLFRALIRLSFETPSHFHVWILNGTEHNRSGRVNHFAIDSMASRKSLLGKFFENTKMPSHWHIHRMAWFTLFYARLLIRCVSSERTFNTNHKHWTIQKLNVDWTRAHAHFSHTSSIFCILIPLRSGVIQPE